MKIPRERILEEYRFICDDLKAREQGFADELGILPDREANKFWLMLGIRQKGSYREFAGLAAVLLASFPSEYGIRVIRELRGIERTNRAGSLIMQAIAELDSLEVKVDGQVMAEYPDVQSRTEKSDERTQDIVDYMIIHVLMPEPKRDSVDWARTRFLDLPDGPVKNAVRKRLEKTYRFAGRYIVFNHRDSKAGYS